MLDANERILVDLYSSSDCRVYSAALRDAQLTRHLYSRLTREILHGFCKVLSFR
jgi:hypothetical protein